MSENQLQLHQDLHQLNDELLWKIFVKAQPKVVARCRLLSTSWDYKLKSTSFLKEHYDESRSKTRSLIIGLGYPPTDRVSNHFIRLFLGSTQQVNFVLPRPNWFNENCVVIGSDHGVVCFRFTAGDPNSRILIWNPLTLKERVLPDDSPRHCCLSMSIFGFGYMKDSQKYCIVHVFKCQYKEEKMRWTLFQAWDRSWNYDGTIDSGIVKLGNKPIVQDGRVHWLGWEANPDVVPSHIAVFDLERRMWHEARIPEDAKTTYHSLTEFNNGVGFVSYQNSHMKRTVQVWQIKEDGSEGLLWEKMIRVSGLGIPHNPTLFSGNDIISVLDCSGGSVAANDTHRTDLWVTRLKHKKKTVEWLLHNTWQEDISLTTITMHSESLFKV
ncbi:hypothetical protein PIB30_029196 [Stylosanthes scabra]|uniref:F-box associated beta-propeller type 1 domain-containing protein n=1 Tax=Stylosanthes scabra TaxID=79078 RepID=A0ABU6QBZ5_9FABA|nr:hypothetical protein [Stylosanthes scabra]